MEMTEEAIGQKIPISGETKEDAVDIEIPVESIPSISIQKWLTEIPVRQGVMGLELQTGLTGPAFIGGLEMLLPLFKGEGGICHHWEI